MLPIFNWDFVVTGGKTDVVETGGKTDVVVTRVKTDVVPDTFVWSVVAAFLLSVDREVLLADQKMVAKAELFVCSFVSVNMSFVVGEKVIGSIKQSC